jgi:cytochrome c oxidase assembly protein subunit 15
MIAHGRTGADIPAIGLAASAAIGALLYLAALPFVDPPRWLVAAALGACLFGAGFTAGRAAGRSAGGGAMVGLVVGIVCMLAFAGMLGEGDATLRRRGASWLAAFGAAAVVLGAAGAALGRRPAAFPAARNWTAILAWVAAATTLLLVMSGGVVTGLKAGLAVEGWLIAEGHLLVLFPVSLMRRNVETFVEHGHRLWGLLVGLSTIALTVQVWRVDSRRWVRGLATAILAAVVVQGVLGGTRVTQQSTALAILHGVTAMLVFASMTVLAMSLGATWRAALPAPRPGAATDRGLSAALLIVVLVQIALGATFRHLQPLPDTPRGALMGLLHGHSFIGSTAVLVLALFCGVRSWGLNANLPPLRRGGTALVHTTVLQVLLGVVAFIVVPKGARPPGESIGGLEVLFTSAHHVVGAVLLAAAANLFAWQRRL